MASDGAPDTKRSSWGGVLLAAGIAFVVAALQESAAAASPNNCGELPGIARTGTFLIGGGIALAIVGGAGVAAAIVKHTEVFAAGLALGAAIVAGLVVGSALTPTVQCGSLPPEDLHAATLTLPLTGPANRGLPVA